MSPGYAAAWLVPLFCGCGLWAAAAGMPRRGAELAAMLGGGFLLGNAFVAEILGLASGKPVAALFAPFAVAASIVGAAAWIWAWRRRRADTPKFDAAATPLGPWRWLVAVLLVLLALRAVMMAEEILLRPVYPWDAWWAWSARAKAWMDGGVLDPVVSPRAWLAQIGNLQRTGTAYQYPLFLARLELWYALGAGAWIEPLVGLPWLGLWAALLALGFGQWRALGVPRLHASMATYALGSLPLLDVHVALAGYADLWITAAFLMAFAAWLRWLKQGQWGQLALALAGLALMPLIKFEGVVWSLCLGTAMAFAAVPARWRGWGALAAMATAVVAIGASVAGDFAWVRLARDLLSGASGGSADSHRFGVLRALGNGLFVQYNWHVLWSLVFGVMLWRWRRLWHSTPLRLGAGVFALSLCFVVGLFLFTPAAKWAESYTAVNRVLLQLVPIALTLSVLLLRDVRLAGTVQGEISPAATPADTDRAVPASSAPE
jgi:hypothetical protein